MADPSRDLFASNRLRVGENSADELKPTTVLERARSFLAGSQETDGHWPGLVYSSVRTTAEYVLLLSVLERVQALHCLQKASPNSADDRPDSANDGPDNDEALHCLLYTSPSPRDATLARMPSSA